MSDNNRLQWFLDRIGKQIFNPNTGRYTEVTSEEDARLLAEGEPWKVYFDTKEEAEQFKM